MLTEQFVAAIGTPSKAPGTNIVKDAAIFIHEFQPLCAQRAVLKKSATARNCVAVSDNHVFAAQIDKGVVHVYNREKGNQEATVPFTERITSISLACDDTVLILGSNEGRIFLWETATGRQITTNQSHLQAVTVLAIDQTSNFLLSASADSTVHVWSLPGLLSFGNAGEPVSPLQTFSSHRSEITDLAVGHSSSFCNIAVSVSRDKTCLIWDYHTNSLLRTYLLASNPICLDLDGADRAVYVGYEDGSIQQLDLYRVDGKPSAAQNSKDGTAPIQPPPSSRWMSPDASVGGVLSIKVSFDSSTVITGHQSGTLLVWDVGRRTVRSTISQSPLPGPVTNLCLLPITGYAHASRKTLQIRNIVKPKFGAFDSSYGFVPGNYAINAELSSDLSEKESDFHQALTAPSFPMSMLDEGLDELAAWSNKDASPDHSGSAGDNDDFMALDVNPGVSKEVSLKKENATLKAQIEALRRLQATSFDKLERINSERVALLQREQDRLQSRGSKKANGVSYEDVDMDSDG